MNKQQVLWLIFLTALLFVPIFMLAIAMLPEPPVYAEAAAPSARLVRTDSGVELLPQPDTQAYGDGGLTYKIHNQSQVTYRYQMEGGTIEVLQDGVWHQLKEHREHRPGDWDTGNLFPGELDWGVTFPYQDLYGLLPSGHYRVLNHIWPIGYFDEAFWVELEFDVTE